ncbi:MAG: cytochrome P450 [Myxococcaceae bacterium]
MNAVTATAELGERIAPGPRGHFLLGSLPDVRRDILGFMHALPETYGEVVRFRLGPETVHLVRRPEHVKHVLLDNHRNYSKDTHGFRALRRILGNGLLTSDGEFWLRQRRIAQPAFHRKHIEGFASLMTHAAGEILEGWVSFARSGEAFDVAEEMTRASLRIVGRTLLGTDITAQADAVADAVTVVLHDANRRLSQLFPMPDFVPTPYNRRFRAARATLDEIVLGMISQRRAKPIEGDLLGMLMAARDEETGEGMSDTQLRDEVMTLFLSGHETTAGALTWTFYLLSKNPSARQRLLEEVATVLQGRTPTAADMPSLPYTTRVLQESMRLYPPAWTVTRRAIDRDTLGGYDVPAGTFVFLSPMVTHRHPEFWPDPESFDPDRFLPERFSSLPKQAYFPFGAGPRGCIGNGFAMLEAQLVLACVSQRYQLELVPDHPVVLEPLVSLRPKHGMVMTAHAL